MLVFACLLASLVRIHKSNFGCVAVSNALYSSFAVSLRTSVAGVTAAVPSSAPGVFLRYFSSNALIRSPPKVGRSLAWTRRVRQLFVPIHRHARLVQILAYVPGLVERRRFVRHRPCARVACAADFVAELCLAQRLVHIRLLFWCHVRSFPFRLLFPRIHLCVIVVLLPELGVFRTGEQRVTAFPRFGCGIQLRQVAVPFGQKPLFFLGKSRLNPFSHGLHLRLPRKRRHVSRSVARFMHRVGARLLQRSAVVKRVAGGIHRPARDKACMRVEASLALPPPLPFLKFTPLLSSREALEPFAQGLSFGAVRIKPGHLGALL